MSRPLAIRVEDLSISYRGLQRTSLRASWMRFGQRIAIYEAVKHVSFEVPEGEILGIVGRNGAGKSTLLRAIAGIFSPDGGTIDLFGHTVSLLSIGVGFNRRLSGRENIYLSGLLLGYDEAAIAAKEEAIADFSELGAFLDKPVRTYSSGMYSKLAFAITAMLESDIMLIDEVLSVGDAQFKRKSYARMRELIADEHRTVIVVSHDLRTVEELCGGILWLDEGRVVRQGPAAEVLPAYREFMDREFPKPPKKAPPAKPAAKPAAPANP
ncbi:MAG: ABC transporter ATP-binding protein [Kiritimatiellae bacterium]|nr:ABC transporter ATP-binding protein [Kiritimatiellia bacterium]